MHPAKRNQTAPEVGEKDSDAPVDVSIVDVSRYFGKVAAVRNVSLSIRKNEFFSLLGPSGCGKTTILRIIGGFEEQRWSRDFGPGAKLWRLRKSAQK